MRAYTMTGLLLGGLLALPAAAGVVYEIEVKDHSGAAPTTTEVAVEGKNIKMEIREGDRGDEGDMIYRGDRREMVAVDHSERSYAVIDEATIREIGGQVNSAMAQMQEALKNVPADQRAMVEAMMKQRMPQQTQAPEMSPTQLRKTGERGEKSGYPCVKYEVLRDGHKLRELWVTDWSNIDGGEDTIDAFEGMSEFMRDMLAALPNFGQSSNGMDDNMFAHMKELGGFPVATREFGDDGSLEAESQLRSAKRQSIDPDAFEPPAGYKRQQMFPQ